MLPEFHPGAEEELSAAIQHGEARAAGLGRELLVETWRMISLLCQSPGIGEPLDSIHRRFPLRRFPFALLYRVDEDRLRIVAVAHCRQRPDYWRDRK